DSEQDGELDAQLGMELNVDVARPMLNRCLVDIEDPAIDRRTIWATPVENPQLVDMLLGIVGCQAVEAHRPFLAGGAEDDIAADALGQRVLGYPGQRYGRGVEDG